MVWATATRRERGGQYYDAGGERFENEAGEIPKDQKANAKARRCEDSREEDRTD
jgi:hypothetical protein